MLVDKYTIPYCKRTARDHFLDDKTNCYNILVFTETLSFRLYYRSLPNETLDRMTNISPYRKEYGKFLKLGVELQIQYCI